MSLYPNLGAVSLRQRCQTLRRVRQGRQTILRSKMHRMSVEDIRKAELCIARNNLEHRRNATGSVSMFPVLESLDLSLGLAVIETVLERDRFLVNGDVCFLVSVPSCVHGFMALCIWQVAREHKNWAGWALLVLFAPTLLASLEILALNCQMPGHSGITQNLIDHAGE